MKKKEPILWGGCDDEVLEFSNEYDLIERILGYMHPPLPEKITICGFARMDVSAMGLNPLEDCLEKLDEEYLGPDSEYSKPTESMKKAEKRFLKVIEKEYIPWMCEEVCRKEIVVAEWIKNNKPGWKIEQDKKEDEDVNES